MYISVTQLLIFLDIIKAQQGNKRPHKKLGLRPSQLPKGRKENTMNTKILYITENEAQVTKAFQKQAHIFGTEEFKLWREYLPIFPKAKMTTKSIKKNPDRKTNRNLTYKNMEKFLSTLPDSETLLREFETIKTRSCVKANPYHFTLAWFEAKVSHYDNFASFIAEVEAERKSAEIVQLASAVNE